MRIGWLSVVALLGTTLWAEDFEAKYPRLIPRDAKAVLGFKVERIRASALVPLLPGSLLGFPEGALEIMLVTPATIGGELKITHGLLPALSPVENENEVRFCPLPTRLSATTEIAGIPHEVEAAVGRWNQPDAGAHAVAQSVGRLRSDYDVWLVTRRPLDLDEAKPDGPKRFRDEFVSAITELRAGIRFGGMNRFVLEASAKTAEDASGLAAIGRWLPGLLQLMGGNRVLDDLLNLVDDYSSTAAGTEVRIAFSIDESRVKDLADAIKARTKKETEPPQ